MISDGLNPVKWIEVKESQKVPRLELDERIQGWTVYQDYLNPLGAGIGSEILLGHTFSRDFMPF